MLWIIAPFVGPVPTVSVSFAVGVDMCDYCCDLEASTIPRSIASVLVVASLFGSSTHLTDLPVEVFCPSKFASSEKHMNTERQKAV